MRPYNDMCAEACSFIVGATLVVALRYHLLHTIRLRMIL